MRKIVVVFVLWCFLPFGGGGGGVYAQKAKLDSLLKANTGYTKQDEKKLQLLNALSDVYVWMQLDSGIRCADHAIALATTLNNQKELAAAYNNKALNIIYKDNNSSASELLQQSLSINKAIKNLNGIADNYVSMAIMRFNDGEEVEAKELLNKALPLFLQANDKDGLAKTNYWMGMVLTHLESDSACITLYQNAISLFEHERNQAGVGFSYNGLGMYYYNIGDYSKSLEWFNKAIKINTLNHVLLALSWDYSNTCLVYYYLSDYPTALQYILNSLRLGEQTGSLTMQGYCFIQMGSIYSNLNQYEKAIDYTQKGITIFEQPGINNNLFLSWAYCEMAAYYSKMNDHSKAFDCLNKALEVGLKNDNESILVRCYQGFGKAYRENKQFDLAILNFKKAMVIDAKLYGKVDVAQDLINIAKCIGQAPNEMLLKAGINPAQKNAIAIEYFQQVIKDADRQFKRDACFELSIIYEEQGETKKSFDHYKQYILLNDSIINSENSNSIANLQIKYEIEKKEQQIALLNKDKEIKLTEIDKQKTQRNSVLGGLALVVMIGGVTYNRYRVKQKANKQLSDALSQLKQTQQQLIEQEKMASLGQLTAGIAHEIQNPLNFVINFSDLGVMLFDEITDATNTPEDVITDLTENITKIEHHSQRAENIVTSMLLHSRNEGTQKQLVNLSEICNEAINFAQHTAIIKYENLKCEITKNIEDIPLINAVYQDLISVVLNLLNNAYHAVNEKQKNNLSYKPEISLQARNQNNIAVIKVIDNGTGIPDEVKNKIFQPFFTTKNTNEGTGLGLSITNDIVKNHGGEITVKSEPGNFTEFTIALPLT